MELISITALSLLMVLLVALTTGPLRVAIGLLFVLFFPGYTLAAALFPRKGALSGIERIALSFGLSIAMVPLIGIALNYTPWSIRPYPIVGSLLVFILVMAGIAWQRRRKLSPQERFQPPLFFSVSLLSRLWGSQGGWDKLLVVLLATAIIGAVSALAYGIAAPREGERFTEFYMLGPKGKAEGYPQKVVLGEQVKVNLAVVNHEFQEQEYRVETHIGGEAAAQIGPLRLAHDEKWMGEAIVRPNTAGANQRVEFLLYKGDAAQPYESLHLWLDVVEPP
jgi:uncharacterized membrane protein